MQCIERVPLDIIEMSGNFAINFFYIYLRYTINWVWCSCVVVQCFELLHRVISGFPACCWLTFGRLLLRHSLSNKVFGRIEHVEPLPQRGAKCHTDLIVLKVLHFVSKCDFGSWRVCIINAYAAKSSDLSLNCPFCASCNFPAFTIFWSVTIPPLTFFFVQTLGLPIWILLICIYTFLPFRLNFFV